jgi:hypothetical protein
MNYLLDTNAWLQLGQAPTQIPLRVRKILLAENVIALSPIASSPPPPAPINSPWSPVIGSSSPRLM